MAFSPTGHNSSGKLPQKGGGSLYVCKHLSISIYALFSCIFTFFGYYGLLSKGMTLGFRYIGDSTAVLYGLRICPEAILVVLGSINSDRRTNGFIQARAALHIPYLFQPSGATPPIPFLIYNYIL